MLVLQDVFIPLLGSTCSCVNAHIHMGSHPCTEMLSIPPRLLSAWMDGAPFLFVLIFIKQPTYLREHYLMDKKPSSRDRKCLSQVCPNSKRYMWINTVGFCARVCTLTHPLPASEFSPTLACNYWTDMT